MHNDENFQPSKKPAIKAMVRIYQDEIDNGTAIESMERKINCLRSDVTDRIKKCNRQPSK